MAGKFEIYKDKAGEFRFRLKSGNGEIVLSSEGYKSRSGAKNGIDSVQNNCSDGSCFEKRQTPSGKYRFSLKAKNKQVIGTSQNYESEASCDNGMQAIARAAVGAAVVDLTSDQ